MCIRDRPLCGAVFGTWIAVLAATRYSSLSALVAAVLAPLWAHLLVKDPVIVTGTAVIALLLIWRHRANIKRLLAGEEDRVGSKASAPESP